MFYYLEGVVSLIDVGVAVIDCGGVGFEVNTTANTLSRLRVGEKASLYTYTVIREDCFDIYGFFTREEKRCFEMLVSVSGVGPKAAQSILSSNTPESLSLAIVSGNEKALTVVPGIGKKIAQRVLLELKDKLGAELTDLAPSGPVAGSAPVAGDKRSDAVAALGVLGFGTGEIAAALKGLDLQNMTVEEIIKAALRNMKK